MRQFALDLFDQFVALPIHLILCIEQGTALLVPLRFERLDLLLTGEFLFQGQGGRGGAPGLLDLAVDFLDFPLQAHFVGEQRAFG